MITFMTINKQNFPTLTITRLLCFTIVLILLSACAVTHESTLESSAVADNNFKTGLLWKIERPGTAPSYVFGTIHSEDPRVTRLPDPVNLAFNQSKSFALEILLNRQASKAVTHAMYFKDGRNLRQVAGEALFQQSAKALLDRGMTSEHVLLMKPWSVVTLLSMPEPKTGHFLDALLYQRAIESGKIVMGLESMEEQVRVFDGMDDAAQVALLRDTLRNSSNIDKMIEETIQVYLSRNLDGVINLNSEYLKFTNEALADQIQQRLIVHRNRRMVERMQPLLQTGNAFIAIGTLHLPGKDGVLQGLQDLGYHLSAVY